MAVAAAPTPSRRGERRTGTEPAPRPTAFNTYLPRLQALISEFESPRILELGGGRMPAFRLEQLPEHVSSYTVNDISADELALAPAAYEKALFDVTGDVRDFAGQFDVVFSKTLLEHVADGEALHRNVLSLLKPGGIAFHMAPTLYALPFVLNRMMPETLSRSILFRFFPNRRSEKPKFPAYYSWCYGNRAKMNGMLQRVGYREVEIINFYGHSYYERIPVLRRIERAWAATAARRDWSTFSSFVHLVARK